VNRGGARGIVLVLAGIAAAQDSGNSRTFERKLREVEVRIQSADWERGQAALLELLERHRDQGYVRARRDDITDLIKKCVFRLQCPKPKPKKLISGELYSYKLSSGKIRVRYTPQRMGDFLKRENDYVHRARFTGPHSIVVKGALKGLVVCSSPQAQYMIGLGNEAFIGVVRGKGKPELLGKVERPAGAIVVSVRQREIVLSSGGKAFLRAPKGASEWGYLALASDGFDSVLLDGSVEPSWLQGLVDQADQNQLAAFEESFDPKEHLPTWLFAKRKAAPKLPWTNADWGWPKLGMLQRFVVDKCYDHYRKGEYEAAERTVKEAKGDLPPAVHAFLLGVAYQGTARLEEAHSEYARARRIAPDFLLPAARDAKVLGGLYRFGEALEACEIVLAKNPAYPDMLEGRVSLLLWLDRLEDAREAAEKAVSHGVTTPGLQLLRKKIDLAVRGPTWTRSFEHKSLRYHVTSDIDAATCRVASGLLEEAYQLFASTLERPPSGSHRYRVFLFSGEAGYKRYVQELQAKVTIGSGGMYQPLLRQLLIWNAPQRALMMKTIRHEGFHQYAHRLMPSPPTWFNEGLAEYFESAETVSDLGRSRPDHLKQLEAGMRPLQELLGLTPPEFYNENALVHYAQAWALIHFLRHGPEANHKLFERMWETFKKVPAPGEATRLAVQGVDLVQFDKDFRRHVAMLRYQR
jgi:tetratricopeptide (TPR) repeat protein